MGAMNCNANAPDHACGGACAGGCAGACAGAPVADCGPPVRVVVPDLAQRVARGLGGEWEARQVRGLMRWLGNYEAALVRIAQSGDGPSARWAAQVLGGDALDDACAPESAVLASAEGGA